MEHHTHSLNGTQEKPTAEPSAACSQGGKLERAQDSTGSRASVAVGGKGRTHLLRAGLCSLRGWRVRGCWCGHKLGPDEKEAVGPAFPARKAPTALGLNVSGQLDQAWLWNARALPGVNTWRLDAKQPGNLGHPAQQFDDFKISHAAILAATNL
jgi:hypothetical protein